MDWLIWATFKTFILKECMKKSIPSPGVWGEKNIIRCIYHNPNFLEKTEREKKGTYRRIYQSFNDQKSYLDWIFEGISCVDPPRLCTYLPNLESRTRWLGWFWRSQWLKRSPNPKHQRQCHIDLLSKSTGAFLNVGVSNFKMKKRQVIATILD